MASRITIEELSIAGFRAYLEGQTIRLREGNTTKSLAVYAPNAKGKSSLVDAIDFYLSNEGTLERLGLRRSGTQAGPEALEHVKAREKGLQRQVTSNAVTEWDEANVLAWINDHQIGKLDKTIVLGALDKETAAYKTLEEKSEREEQQIGLSAIKAAETSVKGLYEAKTAEQGAPPTTSGYIVEIEEAKKALDATRETEEKEKGAAEKAVFKDVWEAADKLFEQEPDIEDCPVCAIPFEEMADEQRARIVPNIKTELADLQAYRDAVTARRIAQQNAEQALENVRHHLESCETLLAAVGYRADHAARLEIYKYTQVLVATTLDKPLPSSSTVKRKLAFALDALRDAKKRLETAQGDHTFGKVLGRINRLIDLENKIVAIGRKKTELEVIYERLVSTEAFIALRLRGYLQHVLDQLKNRMNGFYKSIQADHEDAPALRLELAEGTKQPQLRLLVDFAPNREGVMPSGYMSDSQLHTLALSLRLASIEMANKQVPVVVLDDVVTSYDADHRKAIAALLAVEFKDTQVIVATHDEQFFRYLQDHLTAKSMVLQTHHGLGGGLRTAFS